MNKLVLLSALIALSCSAQEGNPSSTALASNVTTPMKATSFYDLSATTIDGDVFDFSQLKGKRVATILSFWDSLPTTLVFKSRAMKRKLQISVKKITV